MLNDLMQRVFFENTVFDYLFFLGIFIFAVFVLKILKFTLLKSLKAWAKKTKTKIDDFLIHTLERTVLPALYYGVFYFAAKMLILPQQLSRLIDVLGVAVITIVVARLIVEFANYGLVLYWKKRGKDEALERSLKGISSVLKIIVWGLAIMFFLDNLGFRISTVIAGLGIGGVAVALAAQAVLGDLFSYFSILFDRPFEIGDFIILNEYLGTVEYIGIKTTRIRSLGGEQLIFSNTDLTSSRVRNYKRMQKRRVLFKLGVTYQTPVEKLKKIPGIIEELIKSVKDTAFDRAHFFSYGDFNLVIEIVYYVLGPDYNKYMDIQQQINFAIKERFEKEGVEFAYPTQTVFVEKTKS
ncbi:MAG: mechanosensitive ion channel family protein [Candidatus Omnitrophica bacterium]|nr:mechanosensitive ion channel family protein [Candidatus Omnitrophota bacterium]